MGDPLEFRHVDVFTGVPFTGNGLIVLFGSPNGIKAETLISLTAEMRQFELIMAEFQPEAGRVPARIFTAEEELPFAGHPVIGAAAALHERSARAEPARSWVFVIAGREIVVRSRRDDPLQCFCVARCTGIARWRPAPSSARHMVSPGVRLPCPGRPAAV